MNMQVEPLPMPETDPADPLNRPGVSGDADLWEGSVAHRARVSTVGICPCTRLL